MRSAFASLILGFSLLTCAIAGAEERLIIVTGNAEKSMDPNMVVLGIEVWAKAPSAKQAQTTAAGIFKQVKKSLDDMKVKKEDIQTDNYSLNPEYVYDQKIQANRMTGFRVSQSLNVIVRKTDDAGKLIDSIVSDKKSTDSGVNVNNISWDSDQRSKVETSALTDAVHSAKEKAEEIAKAAGVKKIGRAHV